MLLTRPSPALPSCCVGERLAPAMVQVLVSLLFACLFLWRMHVYMHVLQVHVLACAHQSSQSSVRFMLACGIGCRIRAGRLESFGSPAQVYMTAWGARVVDPTVYRPDIRWVGVEHRCQVFRHEPTSSWLMPGPP